MLNAVTGEQGKVTANKLDSDYMLDNRGRVGLIRLWSCLDAKT
jgi:hypothetical protein